MLSGEPISLPSRGVEIIFSISDKPGKSHGKSSKSDKWLRTEKFGGNISAGINVVFAIN
jgi:hypothetical protein